jgi:hypothetical protein
MRKFYKQNGSKRKIDFKYLHAVGKMKFKKHFPYINENALDFPLLFLFFVFEIIRICVEIGFS